MIYYIPRLFKIASNRSFIDIGADELKAYLSIGFREEIVDEINFKGLLRALLGSEDESYDENEALIILDGAIYKYITGKTLHLTRSDSPEESAENTENDLKDINVTERLWAEGKGIDTEARLRAELTDMLLSKRWVPYNETQSTLNKIMLKETGSMDGRTQELFSKLKPHIARILYADILNTLRTEKFNISTKLKKFAPLEGLEPQEGKRIDKLDPGFQNLDVPIEEISKWVEKWMGKKYYVIYENMISTKPVSEEELVEKIEKETGQRVNRRTINNWQSELIKGMKEKFFEGVPQKKMLQNIGIGNIVKTMRQEDFEDFEEFVADKIEGKEETRGLSQTDESINNLKRYVKELKERGDDLNSIARDLSINISTLKAWNYRKLLPWYRTWSRTRSRTRSRTQSPSMSPTRCLSSRVIRVVAAFEVMIKDYRLTGTDKIAFRDQHPAEKILDELSGKYLTQKKEELQKFQKLFEKSFLMPVPRRYDIIIEFKADYDWSDISKGKFDPRMDAEGTWVKDMPMFEWESYNVRIDHTLNSKRYVYNFSQKVHPEGSNAGEPNSSLEVTSPKGGQGIHEFGPGGFFKKFIDEHFSKIRDLGMPPPKGAEFRVEYHNTKLHREYNSTHEFEDAYGGIAFSDAAHADRAEQYAEFRRRVHEKHFGPGRTVAPDMSLAEAQAILKNNLKKNLPESVKKKITEYQAVLNGVRNMRELPLGKSQEIDKFIESLYSAENERLENSGGLEHFREKTNPKPQKFEMERA
jgi:hypothetical protein